MPRETIDCPLYSVCYLCIRKTNHFYVRELLLGRYSHASAARWPTWHPQPARRDRLSRQHRRQNFGRNPPWDAERAQREWLDGIRELQPAAVGEVGLDYATDIDREAQRTWLARQRDLAAELGLPLIVHCVRAYDDLKAMLSGFPLPVIVHGFTGSEQLASQLLDRGWYLSFGKTVERSPKTRRTLRSIPSDRLFLETDMSGEEIESVYRRAADIRNEPAESLRDAVHTNYLNLFGL